MQGRAAALENSLAAPGNAGLGAVARPNATLLGVYPREGKMGIHTRTHTCVRRAARGGPLCPSSGQHTAGLRGASTRRSSNRPDGALPGPVQAAVTTQHTPNGLDNRNALLTFWKLDPRSQCQQIWRLVRAHLLVPGQPSSFLTPWKWRGRSLRSPLSGALLRSMRALPW